MSSLDLTSQQPIDLALLRKAVDASNDGIVIAEQEGDDSILIYANAAFERLSGYQLDDILYRDCRFLQAGERQQEGLNQVREAINAQQSCRVVVRNYRQDGSLFYNELSISPVFNQQDQLTYYIGVQKDVTAQVEAQQALVEAQQELSEVKQTLAQAQQRIAELEAQLKSSAR